MKAQELERIKEICDFLNFNPVSPIDDISKDRLLSLALKAGILPVSALWEQKASGGDPKDRLCKQIQVVRDESLEFVHWLLDDPSGKESSLFFNIGCRIHWPGEEKSRYQLTPLLLDQTLKVTACRYGAEGAMLGNELERKTFELPPPFVMLLFNLGGRLTTSLRGCERCGKLFFNRSDRDVRFCGMNCQAATRVRRMRDKRKKERR